MKNMSISPQLAKVYSGKRVFVTGHTGFKGSWLCEWLLALGAQVAGYSLDPEPHEILFSKLGLAGRIAVDTRGNVENLETLSKAIADFQPEIIIHLAAQPLVRLSYEKPVETFASNVMGTVHLLEATRQYGGPCAVVAVTTDKCYENKDWLHAYREEDAMGGHDPYSASKGAAELVIACYRRSFFSQGNIRVASARAGNVIGGGDWAMDRIIPDCFRALRKGDAIQIRNRTATRPWQHVLDPLSGYLMLAASLTASGASPFPLDSPFNFGPGLASNRTVDDLVRELLKHTGGRWEDASDPGAVHEASRLNLATDKAFHLLGWRPVWNFEEAISKTAAWYIGEEQGGDSVERTQCQIKTYSADACTAGIPWAL